MACGEMVKLVSVRVAFMLLGKRKNAPRWMPQFLSKVEKDWRVKISKTFTDIYPNENSTMHRIL